MWTRNDSVTALQITGSFRGDRKRQKHVNFVKDMVKRFNLVIIGWAKIGISKHLPRVD